MTSRREFLRRGSLWVAGAVALPVVEPYVRRLWAFPTNPLAVPTRATWANIVDTSYDAFITSLHWSFEIAYRDAEMSVASMIERVQRHAAVQS